MPVHIPRDSPAHFEHLFQPLIHSQSLFDTVTRQAADSVLYFKLQAQQSFPNPFLAFCSDASVVVNRADKYSAQLHSMCTSLQAIVPFAYCQIYLTPPNSQTVRAHSDDRDVLLLQVLGQKLWRIYDSPVALPYKHEEVGKLPERPYVPDAHRMCMQSLVCCGDTLYIPRGFVHEGAASSQPSMHITVALQTSDWDYAQLVSRAVLRCLEDHLPARACPFVTGRAATSGDVLDVPLHHEAERNFTAFCQEALSRVSLSRATSLFSERITALRQQRDEEARFNVGESLSFPAPLQLHTRIVWNCDVSMDRHQLRERDAAADDDGIILCKFTRHSTGQNALLSAGASLFRIISRAFAVSEPFAISSIDASSDLLRICAAKIMLRNGYCILAQAGDQGQLPM
jgi:hypothetical protein